MIVKKYLVNFIEVLQISQGIYLECVLEAANRRKKKRTIMEWITDIMQSAIMEEY